MWPFPNYPRGNNHFKIVVLSYFVPDISYIGRRAQIWLGFFKLIFFVLIKSSFHFRYFSSEFLIIWIPHFSGKCTGIPKGCQPCLDICKIQPGGRFIVPIGGTGNSVFLNYIMSKISLWGATKYSHIVP